MVPLIKVLSVTSGIDTSSTTAPKLSNRRAACDRYDVILSPCQPTPPPRIEDTKKPLRSREEAEEDLRRFSFSNAAAIAGTPAISVPSGFTQDGLPIGLQIMARRYDEEAVFRAAHAYEQNTPWHNMRPPVGDE